MKKDADVIDIFDDDREFHEMSLEEFSAFLEENAEVEIPLDSIQNFVKV